MLAELLFAVPIWTGLVALIVAAIHRYLTKDYREWCDVPGVAIPEKPKFPFGNLADKYKGTKTDPDIHREIYRKLKPHG